MNDQLPEQKRALLGVKMGLVEMLLEHVSLKGVLLSIPGLFVAWLVYITLIIVSQNFKLARRGPRANSLPSRLPLGNSSPNPPLSRISH